MVQPSIPSQALQSVDTESPALDQTEVTSRSVRRANVAIGIDPDHRGAEDLEQRIDRGADARAAARGLGGRTGWTGWTTNANHQGDGHPGEEARDERGGDRHEINDR